MQWFAIFFVILNTQGVTWETPMTYGTQEECLEATVETLATMELIIINQTPKPDNYSLNAWCVKHPDEREL